MMKGGFFVVRTRCFGLSGIVIFVLSCFLLVGSGCSKEKEAATASEGTPEFAVTVKVSPVVRTDIKSTIHAVGMLKAVNQAKVSAKVPGKVERLCCEVGKTVPAGAPLLRLEKIDFQLAVNQAEAALQMAEANYTKAKTDWERVQELLEKGIASEQQYDLAKSAFDVAEATVNQAKAELALARDRLENAEVTTLFGGVVTDRFIDLGERISPGQPLFEIAQISSMELETGVSDTRFSEIRLGQPAVISVDGYPDMTFNGKIERIQPAIDPMTRTFKVTIKMENPKGLLKPGMLARADIEVGLHPDSLVIPKAASIEEEGKYYVASVKDGKVDRCEVALGYQDGEKVEVLSGLSEGDQVVTEGAYGLAQGAAVRVSGE